MSILSVGIPESLVAAWLHSGGDTEHALELQQEILGYVSAAYEEWREKTFQEYDD